MASLHIEAPTSSSPLPVSSTDHNQYHYKYELFLSFRGEDTRYAFTDHLYRALLKKGIPTFRDDKLERGEDISEQLLKAIEESRVSIIVFSETYASSRWCLDELVQILECRSSNGQEVRSVFYKVDPSDVRKQTGAFGEAFAKLDQCKYKDSICIWKKALEEAADLSGWHCQEGKYEGEFIDEIIGELLGKVINPSCLLHVAAHPIGLESCREAVDRLLGLEENVVCMVGIWGPGGIGKTTIAKDVFNSICHKFDGSCFLADVRSKSNDLAKLQGTLLSQVLCEKSLTVRDVHQGVGLIKTRMQHKRVLLILDDVSHSSQLHNLVPSRDCFGLGSRILITTRDTRCLDVYEGDKIYEVEMLNDDQAMELFSSYAFKTNGPPSQYRELAERAIRYAGGLPLALIVLGSHLYRRSREEWEATVGSCRGEPLKDIQDVLRLSYDALEADLREVFLDIACFFKGEYVDRVKPVLQACYNSGTGIELLQEKALLRIDDTPHEGTKIWMHDLIEEMGKNIAKPKDKPGNTTRLWDYDDVKLALIEYTGKKEIKGIHLHQLPYREDEICLNSKSFSKMKNLRYLSITSYMGRLDRIKWSGNIDYLSNGLRWFEWFGCSIQSFPSNFHPHKLVKLHILEFDNITRLWDGQKDLPNLKYMDLANCVCLTELPDFTKIRNLIELRLSRCSSLVEIHHSVGSLDKLEILYIDFCTGLEKLPEVIKKLDSLKMLHISACPGYKCKITSLPCSIYGLQNLEVLELHGLSKLVTFPSRESISHGGSGSLSTADFIGDFDCFETLNHLDLSYNNYVIVPPLGKFVNLAEISLRYCKRLQEIPELPPNIRKVNASGCESLERFSMLPKSSRLLEMNLWDCLRFSCCLGNDMKMMENILLNNQDSRFCVVLPYYVVPKWFQYCLKEFREPVWGWGTWEISFEIPSKVNLENIVNLGLAVCAISGAFPLTDLDVNITINGVHIHQFCFRNNSYHVWSWSMWLSYIPLSGEIKGKLLGSWPYVCRVEFTSDDIKSCGVHLVLEPPNEHSVMEYKQWCSPPEHAV